MKLSTAEVLYLTEENWGGAIPATFSPQLKGKAIDAAVKQMFGGASTQFAPFDMQFPVDDCKFHEVKSGTRKWMMLSPNEKEHADQELAKGNDTLIWYFEQLEAPNEYRFFAVAKYSKLKSSFFQSQYDKAWVKRGEQWAQEYMWGITKYTLRDLGEPT